MAVCACSGSPAGLAIIVALPAVLIAAGEVMSWPPSPVHAVMVPPGAMVAVHSEPAGPRLNA